VTSLAEEHDKHDWTVRGLRLPDPLIAMLAAGLWRDPQGTALRALMPWFEDPLVLLTSLVQIERESRSLDLFADDEPSAHLFRLMRGSRVAHAVDLPWLDAEKAVLIAVNRNPGDDVAVALDYRTNPQDPRVVASDFWTNPQQCAWRAVAPTFTDFAARLQLS
jgi:hypothetical protein